MLKGDKGNAAEEGVQKARALEKEAAVERVARARGLVEDGSDSDADDAADQGDDQVAGGRPAGWKALQEDYYVRPGAALKDWDKGLDSDDDDSDGAELADPFSEAAQAEAATSAPRRRRGAK